MDIANELRERGVLDEEECFIDATFVMAKGGGAEVGPTKSGKGMKIVAIVYLTSKEVGEPHETAAPPKAMRYNLVAIGWLPPHSPERSIFSGTDDL